MKKIILIMLMLSLTVAAVAQTLTVRRLETTASANSTCGITDNELKKAVHTLSKSLQRAGIEVQMGTVRFTGEKPSGDANSPLGLWIGGKPIETWLNADRAATDGAVSQTDCPALRVGGKDYNPVPADMIVQAGLLAAGQLKQPAAVSAVNAVNAKYSAASASDYSATRAPCCDTGASCCK